VNHYPSDVNIADLGLSMLISLNRRYQQSHDNHYGIIIFSSNIIIIIGYAGPSDDKNNIMI